MSVPTMSLFALLGIHGLAISGVRRPTVLHGFFDGISP